MGVVNLLAVQEVRRSDRYSLALRALVAKALGGDMTEPLQLGRFEMASQPTANVVLTSGDGRTHVRFFVAAASIPHLLERFDADQTLGAKADYYVDDMVVDDGGFGSDAWSAAEAEDSHEPDAVLEGAWAEVFAFIEREWPRIEELASRLLNGPVPHAEVPSLRWGRQTR